MFIIQCGILLLLLCNHDAMILKLHQKKVATLMKCGFIGSFKVGSVPGMKNKEMLAHFVYKPA